MSKNEPDSPDSIWEQLVDWFYNNIYFPIRDFFRGDPPNIA